MAEPSAPTAASADGSEVFAARCYDAYKIYGDGDSEIRALDGVTVGFEAHRFTAVMGPSGSGKSTLIQCMAGLDHLSAGRSFIGEAEITTMAATQRTLLRRDHLGFVFQAFNLVPSLTAEKNILLPFKLAKRTPDRERYQQIVDMLGLTDRVGHTPGELSGGQQQRVALARALVSSPELLFADEPTGNLDSTTSDHVLGFLRQAVDTMGQSVVMVTHDPRAAAFADRAVFLADGRVVDDLVAPTVASVVDRMRRFSPVTEGPPQ
jgi:putative ABC transport system ATP-binding protein